jgi:putative PIN family toxin of toxin-antitoxin system
MDRTVDVTIPVEPEAAAALADARSRAAVGRLVSRVLRPRSGPSPPRPGDRRDEGRGAGGGLDRCGHRRRARGIQRRAPRPPHHRLIIFDASALVSAALKADSVPERALLRAEEVDVFALSAAVDAEIAEVLDRPKFAGAIPLARRQRVLEILRGAAVWFEPEVRVTDCRDPKDDKYLELALAAGVETLVSSDDDLLVLDPWRGVRIPRPAEYLAVT